MKSKFVENAYQGLSKSTETGFIDYPGIEFKDKMGQDCVIFYVPKEHTEDEVNSELHYYVTDEDSETVIDIVPVEDLQDDLVALTQRNGLTELVNDESGTQLVEFVENM